MKLYTIDEITTKLQEWMYSYDKFEIPLDPYCMECFITDAFGCNMQLVSHARRWNELNEDVDFYVISEGYSKDEDGTEIYFIKIGMTNPAIEEYNSNRNLVV